jgi:hypothetical protein
VKRMADEHSDQEVTVIWIGFQDRPDKIQAYAEKLGIRPVGFDEHNNVARSYGVSYGAGVIFINREGTAKTRIAKGFTEAALREGLQSIL